MIDKISHFQWFFVADCIVWLYYANKIWSFLLGDLKFCLNAYELILSWLCELSMMFDWCTSGMICVILIYIFIQQCSVWAGCAITSLILCIVIVSGSCLPNDPHTPVSCWLVEYCVITFRLMASCSYLTCRSLILSFMLTA